MIVVYEAAPAHNNPTIPGPNSEFKKLPSYSPFLNIVEQAIKVDISRPEQQEQMNNREEARRQGNSVRQFQHSVATSRRAEKDYDSCEMWSVVQTYANVHSKMFK